MSAPTPPVQSGSCLATDVAALRGGAALGRRWPLLDGLGIALSVGCAIHCAALPLLVLTLPAWDSSLEFLPLVLVAVALLAVGRGIWNHRRYGALVPFAAGALAILGAEWWHEQEAVHLALSIVASALLITAHVMNLRACRAHAH